MIKTFKYKLYSSKKNKKIHNDINIACDIYNHCVSLHKRYYKLTGKYLNLYQLQKHITKLKKRKKYSFWNQLNSQTIQDITQRIDKAYKLFFKKSNKTAKPPESKSKHRYKSITFKQTGYKLIDNILKIGKTNFKLSLSRELEGKIKTVTLKRDTLGDLYVFCVCKVPKTQKKRIMTGNTAGLDFGLKTYLTVDNGEKIESPLFLKKSISKLRTASRNLSRKKKGSNNRKKARRNLASLHRKVTNQRNDFHFKLARDLTSRFDELYFEDLNIEGMKRKVTNPKTGKKTKKRWGRKVSDLSFSSFMDILEYYCEKEDVKLVKIDRFFPSSKLCNNCGWKNKDLKLEDRTWTCEICGSVLDRDINAARNIKAVGASTVRGVDKKTLEIPVKESLEQSALILESHML